MVLAFILKFLVFNLFFPWFISLVRLLAFKLRLINLKLESIPNLFDENFSFLNLF